MVADATGARTGRPLRGVLIGCGHVSQHHLTAWSRIRGASIVAVADRVSSRASERAAEFGIGRFYSEYEEMLEREQPDFVDIATRPDSHPSMVAAAAEVGADVLCQKPVAESLSELEQMVAACEAQGVAFAVNENFRFQPWFRSAREIIVSGALGRVHHVAITTRARLTLPTPRFEEQPYFVSMPRLLVYEFGVHMLDSLRYLIGEFETVAATMSRQSDAILGEDVATVLLRSESGCSAVVDLSWASDFSAPSAGSGWLLLRIEGSAGTLELRPDWKMRLVTEDQNQEWQFDGEGQAGYTAMQQHFVDALQANAEVETSAENIAQTMELVFGAYHAAEHGRIYRVGLDRSRLA